MIVDILNVELRVNNVCNLAYRQTNSSNSLRPTDAYMSVNQPALAQIMACRLVGTEPLFEPMIEYC